MSLKNSLNVVLFVALLAAPLASGAFAQEQECDVRRLGGPNRFYDATLESVAELQEMVRATRADIENVMRQVGFQGNPADFFAAVERGSGITTGVYEKGTEMEWMAVREKGQPTAKTDKCWGGAQPFEAWTVNFESEGSRYHFAVPKICANVMMLGSEALPEPPVCELSVSCDGPNFVVSTTGSSPGVRVTYSSPSGQQGTYSRPFEPTEDGDWTFVAEATRDGLQCREEVTREACPAPKLQAAVSVSPNPAPYGEEITIDVDCTPADRAGMADVTVTYEGETVLADSWADPHSWTGTTLRRPGVYDIRAVCEPAEGMRAIASDAATARLEILPRPTQWVIRGFGGGTSVNDEEFREEGPTAAFPIEQRELQVNNGDVFGLSAEYLMREHFGLEFGLEYFSHDVMFVWDTPTVWGMGHDDIDTPFLFVAPNYHFTGPEHRADFYAGVLLGFVFGDSARINDQGESFEWEMDDDFGYGLQLGFDYPICPRGESCWTFTSKLQYLDLGGDFDSVADPRYPNSEFNLDLTPFVWTVGAGYRF